MEYREARDIAEAFDEKWINKEAFRDAEVRRIAAKINKGMYNRTGQDFVREVTEEFKASGCRLPSEFFKKRYGAVVDGFVLPEYREDFYRGIDGLNRYPYTQGMGRRTMRTEDYTPWFWRIFMDILISYKQLEMFGGSLCDYLSGNMPEKLRELRNTYESIKAVDYLIAFRLDRGDRELSELLKEIILGDNNVAYVSVDIIRGIVKSKDAELHRLLADFLLAAQLQEGVRQAVCENADCGTVEAFRIILDTICDNGLIRFASVRRAVGTWTGLGDMDGTERVATKVLGCVKAALDEDGGERAIKTYLASNDSIEIVCGLWALGFFDIKKAIRQMEAYAESGTRNQIITTGYYKYMMTYMEDSVSANEYNAELNRMPAFYRIPMKVIIRNPKDYVMLAVFIESLIPDTMRLASALRGSGMMYAEEGASWKCEKLAVSRIYPSEEDARGCFAVLRDVLKEMPGKKMEFEPVIFPWFSASLSRDQLISRLCITAYALEDEALLAECCDMLPLTDASGYNAQRHVYLELLTYGRTHLPKFRETILKALADKETYTRKTAFAIAKRMELTEEDCLSIENYLKYKTDEIRKNVLTLLNMQEGAARLDCAVRLIGEKSPELRMGGISILQSLKEEEKAGKAAVSASLLDEQVKKLAEREDLTESERVVVNELSLGGNETELGAEQGYGLYDPKAVFFSEPQKTVLEKVSSALAAKPSEASKQLTAFFSATKEQLDEAFAALEKFYYDHGNLEYRDYNGEERLLANDLYLIESPGADVPFEDRYPFKELWVEFYEKYIKSPALLLQLRLALRVSVTRRTDIRLTGESTYYSCLERLLGKTLPRYKATFRNSRFHSDGEIVLNILSYIYPEPGQSELGKKAAEVLFTDIKEKERRYTKVAEEESRFYFDSPVATLLDSEKVDMLLGSIKFENDEDFKEFFMLNYRLDLAYPANKWKREEGKYNDWANLNRLEILDFVRAEVLGVIPENEVYKAVFEYYNPVYAIRTMSRFLDNRMYGNEEKRYVRYRKNNKWDEESAFYRKTVWIYRRIADRMLDVELKRGDLPTVFSQYVSSFGRIYGAERLVQILTALGKTSLNRTTYYSVDEGLSKRASLSHLLSVSRPEETDSAEKLKALLQEKKISKDRIYEVMMYAPQWIDMLENYLGKKLKSCCYYFMAHMNEYFDEKKKAIISKYTPLSAEDLNRGAFDKNWFLEAYGLAGEEIFQKLYTAAKYISDSNAHGRARKYADAALGKVSVSELEAQIREKRNKDLLMSYGIVPFADEDDMLRRYQFVEEFRKESRQFGAQRRASEGTAADMALRNMATNAGYQDEIRLVLAMETQLVEKEGGAFEPHQVGDGTLQLTVTPSGKAELAYIKGGKKLKSVPAALKKDEYVLHLANLKKKLNEQYSRAVKMFERAMEEQEGYTFRELWNLRKNPVIWGIAGNLLFAKKEGQDAALGLLCEEGLVDYAGKKTAMGDDEVLCVAHPYHLYENRCWSEYQKMFFREMSEGVREKQAFKQVFRELYVKLPEELEKLDSRMFAGNQIQPKKTAACLKGRRWIADYEDGLQKVYYKGNIIAQIYALADWFSPSDVEAPTLEWVVFYDRKTFETLKIKDVPPVIYSEVMRDVDLAVSVAHVGGVDPETSHSTVELRRVIVEHNLPLFGLKNVSFEGNHAVIKGKLAEYSVHLGSGVIHVLGGPAVNVLPVHSQSRGKLFLPFIDDDPKTAEIMSKIVLFAQDEKLKDPYILDQLRRGQR